MGFAAQSGHAGGLVVGGQFGLLAVEDVDLGADRCVLVGDDPVRPKPSTGGSLAWVAYGALVAAARELGEAGTTSYLATALPAQLRDAAFAG